MEINFNMEDASDYWRAVNDGVMGGRSSGGPTFEDGVMTFAGDINTNGGGFSSIRAGMERGALTGSDGLMMRVKPDERGYKVTMRTDATYRGRRVSFQAPLPQSEVGEWENIYVPFDSVSASLFGRPIDGAKFDSSAVQEIGIIIADGRDGPFQIDVKWIKGCKAP